MTRSAADQELAFPDRVRVAKATGSQMVFEGEALDWLLALYRGALKQAENTQTALELVRAAERAMEAHRHERRAVETLVRRIAASIPLVWALGVIVGWCIGSALP
jgi:hypothetical protein